MQVNRMALLLAHVCIPLSQFGCGAVIRSSIDTQPRVHVSADAAETPEVIVNGKAVAYVPGPPAAACDEDLVEYAPIIIQGFQPDKTDVRYDYESDAIGMPVCSADGKSIRIDVSNPMMFGRVEHAVVHGVSLKQLTYVYWYPRRDMGSIETGEVDGGILRVTLDAVGNPAVFEVSQTCGCYHGVFASACAEALARQEFGPAQPPRQCSLERSEQESEWIVRGVVDVRAGQRPVLYVSAGEHFCEFIRFIDADTPLRACEERSYMLDHYDRLESIPSDAGGTASMFNEKKLVRGGKRWKEELFFSDIDHPGWPRHLDVMSVHWDRDRWNDPSLLERKLRMPRAICESPRCMKQPSSAK